MYTSVQLSHNFQDGGAHGNKIACHHYVYLQSVTLWGKYNFFVYRNSRYVCLHISIKTKSEGQNSIKSDNGNPDKIFHSQSICKITYTVKQDLMHLYIMTIKC